MWKRKKYVREIDRYELNLLCRCTLCKKYEENRENRPRGSCEAYPKEKELPPRIWNGDMTECEYFEPTEKGKEFVERYETEIKPRIQKERAERDA